MRMISITIYKNTVIFFNTTEGAKNYYERGLYECFTGYKTLPMKQVY